MDLYRSRKMYFEIKGKIKFYISLIKCHVKKTYVVALNYTVVKWSVPYPSYFTPLKGSWYL